MLAASLGMQPEHRLDAIIVPMRHRGGVPPPLQVTCFLSLGPAEYGTHHTRSHRATNVPHAC